MKIYTLISTYICIILPLFAVSQTFQDNMFWSDSTWSSCDFIEPYFNENTVTSLYQYGGSHPGTALIRLDAKGDTVWQKCFDDYKFYDVEVREDGNIVVAMTKLYNDGIITIFDSAGTILSQQAYESGSSIEIEFTDVYLMPDSSIYFTGSYRDIYSGGSVTYRWRVPVIGKIKSDKTFEWCRTFGTHTQSNKDDGYAYAIEPIDQNNSVAIGVRNIDQGGFDYVTKLSSLGTSIWSLDRPRNGGLSDLAVSKSGSIYLLRSMSNAPIGNTDFIIEKLSNSGDTVWSKVYGTANGYETGSEIMFNDVGELIVSGSHKDSANGDIYISLTKLDTNGNLLSNVSFQNIGVNSTVYNLDTTAKGEILLCGRTPGQGGWVLKTDKNGASGCIPTNKILTTMNYISGFQPANNVKSQSVKLSNNYSANRAFYPLTKRQKCYGPPPCNITANISLSNMTPCEGEKVSLQNSSSGQSASQWYINGSSISHGTNWDTTFTGAGSYVVKLNVMDGSCQDSSIVTIQVKPTASSSISKIICDGTSFNFNGQLLTQTGVYTDTLAAANNCDSVITLNLTVSNPDTMVTVASNILTAASNASYQWVDCNTGQPISGATNQNYSALQNGSYKVVVTDSIGCIDSSNCHTITGIGLQDFTEEAIQIMPNPFNEYIQIYAPHMVEIKVIDGIGRVVYKHSQLVGRLSIPTENWERGVYTVIYTTSFGEVDKIKMIRK